MMKAQIGMVGLAVMGENMVMNLESKGFAVAAFDIAEGRVAEFVSGRAAGKRVIGCESLQALVASLERPRRVMLLIRAGSPVDSVIAQLKPLLESGDVIIDGGNSHHGDTQRRMADVEAAGLLYIGTGVSGGEEGALRGPSLMPGGSPAAWPLVKDVFEAICAKVDGEPCCGWVGAGGAGHFVKMVHNGIEYGDMQLIAEGYQILRDGLGMAANEIADVFEAWNGGELSSYLIEITANILRHTDPSGVPTLDLILDAAGQKGTGKWSAASALDHGVPLTLIAEAVFARCLSARKAERVRASGLLEGPDRVIYGDRATAIADLMGALYAAKIISYAQGYQLLRAADAEHNWGLDYGAIARMWRGGCIIRSQFLGRITDAYRRNPALENLLLDPHFREVMRDAQPRLRRTLSAAILAGIPVPALSAAMSDYDGYRCQNLPANLIQAQRDYFGAHGCERLGAPRGQFFHTNWTGAGGETASGVYTV